MSRNKKEKGQGETQSKISTATLSGKNLTYGPIHIDKNLARVSITNRIISLSPKEYEILIYFVEHPEVIISRDELYEGVWGNDSSGHDNLDTINVHIAHLRKKLGIDCITTIKHQGYAFELS